MAHKPRAGVPPGKEIARTTNKRQPYTPRACGTCRRRKRKCDGVLPCSYCHVHGFSCSYLADAHPLPRVSDEKAFDANATSPERLGTMPERDGDRTTVEQRCPPFNNVRGAQNAPEPYQLAATSEQIVARPCSHPTQTAEPRRAADRTKAEQTECHGPTSPTFSLNFAQNQLLAPNDPAENEVHSQLSETAAESLSYSFCPQSNIASPESLLLDFMKLLSVEKAVAALSSYQRTVGDLHPVLNIEDLISNVKNWFHWLPTSDTSDRHQHRANPPGTRASLLILNLALSIGLLAEDQSLGNRIYDNCAEIGDSVLMWPSVNEEQVVSTFLRAIAAFYRDSLRYAWRMTGLAGRLLLELGYHNISANQSRQKVRSIVTLVCSVLVFDRQMSVSTGLPPDHTAHSKFGATFRLAESVVESPYLRAMASLLKICDQFEAPMDKIAEGQSADEEEVYEIKDLQIQQWRRKAIGQFEPFAQDFWTAELNSCPPFSRVLLYLRANGIRKLLLRPFFFPSTASDVAIRYIHPTMCLTLETTSILHSLDHQTTDMYRQHRPFYHHILACACASLFLVTSFIQSNGTVVLSNLPTGFAADLETIFVKSITLASKYSDVSKASKQLHERLVLLKDPLIRLKFLSPSALSNVHNGTSESGVIDEGSSGILTLPTEPESREEFGYDFLDTMTDLSDLSGLFDWSCINTEGFLNLECL